MSKQFSPSINILRDESREFKYIATPNTKRVVDQIQDDITIGLRSFNLIGSYGTGKSSFLLALEQTLIGQAQHFDTKLFANSNCSFLKIVGSYQSIIDVFAEHLGVNEAKHRIDHILAELFAVYQAAGSKNQVLVIVIDEFGKFLEYAAKNRPEKELYFVQQLAEFANNSKYNIVLITSVHQSFDTYAYDLNKSLRHEWIKVKGRFKEITFNEPVEQLLYLAAEHISAATTLVPLKRTVKVALSLFETSKGFKAEYSKEIAAKLFPLDLLAANVLTISLQRYGQNERSLFSFLESTDSASLSKFKLGDSDPFYNLANVFDYLTNNFFSFLNSKYNPDAASWSAIKVAIEQVENTFDKNLNGYLKIIKTIGLLNNFSNAGSILDEDFLTGYAKYCLGINNAEELVKDLVSKSIIRYRKHSKRYVLTEETEIDIELALIEANQSVSAITDVPTVLKKYFEFSPVLAKEYSYINGTSRYFQFEITEYPTIIKPIGEIDGYIQLIFNDQLDEDIIKQLSVNKAANIFVYYKNAKKIKALLYDLEKTQKVLTENQHDRVARKELESIIVHEKTLLNHYILTNLYKGSTDIVWFWNNDSEAISSKKEFNQLLTQVCKDVYCDAPKFKNELVNKHKISSAIHTAKRSYFKGLVNHWDKPDLGIPENKFPPEKMIFKSLLKDNGLAPYRDETYAGFELKPGDSFYKLWKESVKFLNSTKSNRKPLTEFFELLSTEPFKLKQGFIDFWVPSFLFLKRDDFALYVDNAFIPYITEETLELMVKKPKDFEVKAFDIDGVKLDIFNSYRVILDQEIKERIGNVSFIETIKPFLIFYRSLPDYAKNTLRLSKPALAIRDAISKSKDPEYTFFESFPTALGTTLKDLNEHSNELVTYTDTLQNAIREIRTCFDSLIDRFENYIKQDILFEETTLGFEEMKSKIQHRYQHLKRHLLLQKQKSFVQRIDSLLDDNRAWLSSVCQAIVGKSLENLRDEDEYVLYESFKSMVQDLDGLTELSAIEIDESKEQVYNIQFNTFGSMSLKSIVRVPKVKSEQLDQYVTELENKLTGDADINKLVLTTLLQKLLSHE
ncbi:hypothetical protein MUGA111182_04820 [Mucilaginibacter galii]|uniref:ATP-binding protein n=1 Tax=Mucilaginibacter galii TaxID=2005073 RepID=A0A917JB26_9SPHI|nr:hypothetical protein [Mucilaginibacter galii]GGI50801.1 hypothetical protein GCM10011425_20130 [Mucilaginibacter galii]